MMALCHMQGAFSADWKGDAWAWHFMPCMLTIKEGGQACWGLALPMGWKIDHVSGGRCPPLIIVWALLLDCAWPGL